MAPEIPEVLLLTVATDCSRPEYQNFILSAMRQGWSEETIRTLGCGETWGGFAWRSRLVGEHLALLPQDSRVIVCDSYDLLVTNTPAYAERILEESGDVHFSTEETVALSPNRAPCPGLPLPKSVCAGCVGGKAGALAYLYGRVRDAPDDQRAMGRLLARRGDLPHGVTFDTEEKLAHTYTLGRHLGDIVGFYAGTQWRVRRDVHAFMARSERPVCLHVVGSFYDANERYAVAAAALLGPVAAPVRVLPAGGHAFRFVTALVLLGLVVLAALGGLGGGGGVRCYA
jgi:hypothetical protein